MRCLQTLMRRAPLIPTLSGALLVLTACAGSTPSGARLDPPPPSLSEPCQWAVALPAGDMSQAQVERFWRTDRARLASCRDKHDGLVRWAEGVVSAIDNPSRGGRELREP